MGYYKRHVELNPTVVDELRQSSELDPAKSYKDADEQYVDSLSPMERQVLFTTIRRVIRDKKRKAKIKLLEVENYKDADLIQISDDSESGKQMKTLRLLENWKKMNKKLQAKHIIRVGSYRQLRL